MLKKLKISNFAIADELSIEFSDSFNVFTGETGAGKSVIINALNFVLGARASGETIKAGRPAAEVSAEFVFEGGVPKGVENFLNIERRLSLYRKIDSQGRGKAQVNGENATISKLAEIGEYLVDFHGQHDNQSLLKPVNHLLVLDKFAGCAPLTAKTAKAFELHKRVEEKLEALRMDESEKARMLDLYSYQLGEIDSLEINLEKDLKLDAELPRLRNSEKIVKLCTEADMLLAGEEGGAITQVYGALKALQQLSGMDDNIGDILNKTNEAAVLLEEVNSFLGSYAAGIDLDPSDVDAIIARHDKLNKLKTKYGPSLEEVLAKAEELRNKIDDLQTSDFKEKQLERELAEFKKNLLLACRELHEARTKAAKKLSALVCKELEPLGFGEIKFEIAVEMDEENLTANGADGIEFLFSSNPGQPVKPLKNIASGGELSRVMLGLKTVLSAVDNIPVLVFDEIDAGIGGEVGLKVGEKIAKIALGRQVLCVTHLAQVAGFAKAQYLVAKNLTKTSSSVSVASLAKEERVTELARMLGGLKESQNAVKHARELLESAIQI